MGAWIKVLETDDIGWEDGRRCHPFLAAYRLQDSTDRGIRR